MGTMQATFVAVTIQYIDAYIAAGTYYIYIVYYVYLSSYTCAFSHSKMLKNFLNDYLM